MARTVTAVPGFNRAAKKLVAAEKAELDQAIKAIAENPDIGESKKGDLAGLLVQKFKVNKQIRLLGYTVNDNEITLVSYGTHENFYRDLKR